jgi:type I restriction enzyme S subunit
MESVALGSVASVKSGFAFKSKDWKDDGVPVIKIANVKDGFVTLDGCSYVDEAVAKSAAAFELRPGDILISMTGYIGEIARVRNEGRMLLNQRVGKFNIKQGAPLDGDFLFHCLRDPELKAKFVAHAYGAAQPNISPTLIEQQEIPFPPLPIQRRIAGILSAYDELIENSQRRIKILESMARALYREWFVHFRFPGHESVPRVPSPLGEIPQGWEVRNVKNIAMVTYGFPFASKKFNTDGNGTPVIRIRDIPEGLSATFTEEDAEPKYHVKNCHILVGMDGDFHMCIWSGGHAFQNQRIARFESNGEIGNLHMFLALEKPIQEFNKAIVGTTVAHLGDMHIKTIQIVWPPINFRKRAKAILEPIAEQVIALKRQIRNLRRARDLLLPRLLSGQINVEAMPA